MDRLGRLSNDKTFFLPTDDPGLLALLNSPLMWWFNWRNLTHLKDEALSPLGYKMEQVPIAPLKGRARKLTEATVEAIIEATQTTQTATRTVSDWLRFEFKLDKLNTALANPSALDADAFVTAVRRGLPKKRELTGQDINKLMREHAATIEPALQARAEIFALERRLSDLVNEAYGLTPEEVQLMWRTAPPRMPFTPRGLVAQEEGGSTRSVGQKDAR